MKTLNECTPPIPTKKKVDTSDKINENSSTLENLYVCRRVSNTPDNAHTDT